MKHCLGSSMVATVTQRLQPTCTYATTTPSFHAYIVISQAFQQGCLLQARDFWRICICLCICALHSRTAGCALTIALIHMQEHPAGWCSHPSTTTSMSIFQACKLAKGLSPALITKSHSNRQRKSQKALVACQLLYGVHCYSAPGKLQDGRESRFRKKHPVSHFTHSRRPCTAVMLPSGGATLSSVSICLAAAA